MNTKQQEMIVSSVSEKHQTREITMESSIQEQMLVIAVNVFLDGTSMLHVIADNDTQVLVNM